MKAYIKPSIEIISMRTSENIANNDNGWIKTLYVRASGTNMSDFAAINNEGFAYDSDVDINGSNFDSTANPSA